MLPGWHPAHVLFGPLLWVVWFLVLYGGLSLGCELARPPPGEAPWTWLNLAVAIFTLVGLAPLVWLAHSCWRARDAASGGGRLYATLGAAMYIAAAAATLYVGLPLAKMPLCL